MLQKVFVVTLIVVDLPPNKHFSSLSEIEGGSALSIHFCIFMGLESRKKGEKKSEKKKKASVQEKKLRKERAILSGRGKEKDDLL